MAIKYTQKWKLLIYLILAIVKSMQIVFIAYLFKSFINFAQTPKGSLVKLTIIAIGGLLVFAVFTIAYEFLYYNIINEVNLKLKSITARYLVRDKENLAGIDASFMTNDLKQIETNKIEAELAIIFNAIQFIAALVSALLNAWELSLIFLVASFAPALLQNIFGPKIERSSEKWEEANSRYTETVNDTISAVKMARLYNVENSIVSRLIKSAKLMEEQLLKTNRIKGSANELTMTFAYICSLILPFSFGIYFVIKGQISLGTFMMISQLANNFINPIVLIFSYVNDIKTTTPIWTKIQQLMIDSDVERNGDLANFSSLELQNASVKINDKTIFSQLNLKINVRDKVLLEAPSGWGKSTLLQVLVGNLRLGEGKYLINGLPVDDPVKIHNYFSYINQKPIILDDTLKYNITLGRKVTDRLLKQVAEKAGLGDLVAEKGWDYSLGKDGKNLSGGQNQRVEIARALLSNRPILIADEATSSLDKELSEQIHNAILHDFPGTVIEVAHKVSDEELGQFTQVIDLAE